MSDREEDEPVHAYRIGAVSRLTGVPPDTLRVWERRYGVVTPQRSDSGTRLYGPEDVGRLTLIKQLVDRGDAISQVAGLSLDELRERMRRADLPFVEREPAGPCRVVVLGRGLAGRLRQEALRHDRLELVGLFPDRERFLAEAAALGPDVAVLEFPTVHPEQVREIAALVTASGAARGLVVYQFAASQTLARLDARGILRKRAPLDSLELRRWCLAAYGFPAAEAAARLPAAAGTDLGEPIPPRRFDEAALARVAAAAPGEGCECPQHLADLVSSLAAFEDYSEECELRNVEDAALYAFLHTAAAKARSLMEDALARALEAQGRAPDEQTGTE